MSCHWWLSAINDMTMVAALAVQLHPHCHLHHLWPSHHTTPWVTSGTMGTMLMHAQPHHSLPCRTWQWYVDHVCSVHITPTLPPHTPHCLHTSTAMMQRGQGDDTPDTLACLLATLAPHSLLSHHHLALCHLTHSLLCPLPTCVSHLHHLVIALHHTVGARGFATYKCRTTFLCLLGHLQPLCKPLSCSMSIQCWSKAYLCIPNWSFLNSIDHFLIQLTCAVWTHLDSCVTNILPWVFTFIAFHLPLPCLWQMFDRQMSCH